MSYPGGDVCYLKDDGTGKLVPTLPDGSTDTTTPLASPVAPKVVEIDASSGGTYNVLPEDDIINVNDVDTGDYTIQLPAAANMIPGKTVFIKDATGSASSPRQINILTNASETIDQFSSISLAGGWLGELIYSNGTNLLRKIP